jgi:hypothetical protein
MYAMTQWENNPSTKTALNESRLNNMEKGIYEAHFLPIRNLAVNGQLELPDGNGAVIFNSSSDRTFTFRAQTLVPLPAGVQIIIGNEGTGNVNIVDNTTGTPSVVRTLHQGEFVRWFKTSTADTWLVQA